MDLASSPLLLSRLTFILCSGILLLVSLTGCGSTEDETRPTDASASPTSASSGARPSTTPNITATPVVIDDALWKRVRRDGMVMVIVTLNIPFQPESQLSGQAAIDAQRTAITVAQDELVASLTDGEVEVVTRMAMLPQIVLKLDEPGLRQLATSPLVLAVQENSLSAPTS